METFHAGLDRLLVNFEGARLLGGLYRAEGQGPRPTAILLHGLPGIEKNLDLAFRLREAGWNAAYFHYRGSWGSGGAYSLDGCPHDLLAVADWIGQQPCVDGERLALIGHSWGGYVALTTGAADPRFKAIIAICPLVSQVSADVPMDAVEEDAEMLQGISAEELKAQYERLPAVASMAVRLLGRPILILTGRGDPDLQSEHYAPLREAVPTIQWHEFEDGDHFLTLCRRPAVDLAVNWLVSRLGR